MLKINQMTLCFVEDQHGKRHMKTVCIFYNFLLKTWSLYVLKNSPYINVCLIASSEKICLTLF